MDWISSFAYLAAHFFYSSKQVRALFSGASVGKIIGLCFLGLVIAYIMCLIGYSIYNNDKEEGPGYFKKAGFFALLSLVCGICNNIFQTEITYNAAFILNFWGGLAIILIINLFTFGILRFIPYTAFQCTTGMVAGWLVGDLFYVLIPLVAVILVIVFIVRFFIFIGEATHSSDNSTNNTPEYTRNTSTGKSYHTTQNVHSGDDRIFIRDNDTGQEKLVRKDDYGNYIDDDKNTYV